MPVQENVKLVIFLKLTQKEYDMLKYTILDVPGRVLSVAPYIETSPLVLQIEEVRRYWNVRDRPSLTPEQELKLDTMLVHLGGWKKVTEDYFAQEPRV